MDDWFEAEQHAERAHRYYEAGQWSRALDELQRALAVNPDQGEWHFGLGLTLDALERYGEAAQAYEQCLVLEGDNADVLVHWGIDLLRSGRPGDAVGALERASTLEPGDPEPYAHRVLAFAQMGEHDRAEVMFYLAQQHLDEEEDPELAAMAYDHVAHSLAMCGRMDRALWCWERCLRLDPHAPQAHANLARAHWRAGRTDRAREQYLDQLRSDPGDIASLLELGTLLVEVGRPAEAGEKFRRALEMDPTVAEAHLRLGELALTQGHHDAAADRFERARRLDPAHPGVHMGLAQVARGRGDLEAARRLARAELDHAGQAPPRDLALARMLVDLGLDEDAEALLAPLLAPPPSPSEVEVTGEGASSPGAEGEAASAAGSAPEASEGGNAPSPGGPSLVGDPAMHATALLCRAVLRLRRGDRAQGVADCRAALRAQPGNLAAMQNLVLAHLDAGRLARAAVWLRRALAVSPDHADLRKLRRRLTRQRLRALIRRAAR